jgi:Immunity protein 45
MPKLTELDRDILWTGDILRLPENYDLGPGSTPVDLIVFDPNDSDCGLGILVVSGYKAGLIYALLPQESQKDGTRCIDMGWMKANWDKWFCYPYEDSLRIIPMDETLIMAWDGRETVECA